MHLQGICELIVSGRNCPKLLWLWPAAHCQVACCLRNMSAMAITGSFWFFLKLHSYMTIWNKSSEQSAIFSYLIKNPDFEGLIRCKCSDKENKSNSPKCRHWSKVFGVIQNQAKHCISFTLLPQNWGKRVKYPSLMVQSWMTFSDKCCMWHKRVFPIA